MSPSSQRQAHASAPTHPDASPSANLKRRRFLLALGAGGAGATAATLPIVTGVADPAAATESASGYRESEHVRDYYATTRI
jgi:hypothetical protein